MILITAWDRSLPGWDRPPSSRNTKGKTRVPSACLGSCISWPCDRNTARRRPLWISARLPYPPPPLPTFPERQVPNGWCVVVVVVVRVRAYVCMYVYMYVCMYVCTYSSTEQRELQHAHASTPLPRQENRAWPGRRPPVSKSKWKSKPLRRAWFLDGRAHGRHALVGIHTHQTTHDNKDDTTAIAIRMGFWPRSESVPSLPPFLPLHTYLSVHRVHTGCLSGDQGKGHPGILASHPISPSCLPDGSSRDWSGTALEGGGRGGSCSGCYTGPGRRAR